MSPSNTALAALLTTQTTNCGALLHSATSPHHHHRREGNRILGPIDVPCAAAPSSGRPFDSARGCTDRELFGWAQWALDWVAQVGRPGGLGRRCWPLLCIEQRSTYTQCGSTALTTSCSMEGIPAGCNVPFATPASSFKPLCVPVVSRYTRSTPPTCRSAATPPPGGCSCCPTCPPAPPGPPWPPWAVRPTAPCSSKW